MLALMTVFFTSFMLAFSGAMMPGPLLTATISESMSRGAATGPLLILGHAVLEFALVLALLFGLAPFLTRDSVFIVIALSGAGILAWMAFGMLRDLPGLKIDWNAHQDVSKHLVPTGIIMSLANPYWSIWWATIGLGYIITCRVYGSAGIAAFFLGHISADFVWYSMISFLVARGRHILTNRVYRGVIAACAVFLICFAGLFAYAGINRLAG